MFLYVQTEKSGYALREEKLSFNKGWNKEHGDIYRSHSFQQYLSDQTKLIKNSIAL